MTITMPGKTDLIGSPVPNQGKFKAALGQMYDFISQTLPTDGSKIPLANIAQIGASSVNNQPAGNIVSTNQQAVNAELDSRIGAGGIGKNKIINGDMVIDQRNNGAAQNAITSSYIYLLDRWYYSGSQPGKFNGGQNLSGGVPPTGFTNYLGFTVASAYTVGASDYFFIGQRIEGVNCRDLGWGTTSAKPVTLQFQVYSSLAGQFSGAICNYNATMSYPFSYTITQPNSWVTITVTIPGSTSGSWLSTNNVGVLLVFNLGAGTPYLGTAGVWAGANYIGTTGSVNVVGTAGAIFYITGVQLEKGNVATPFEILEYGDALRKCQRYYRKLTNYPIGITVNASYLQDGRIQGATMRAIPTLDGGATFVAGVGSNGTPALSSAFGYVSTADCIVLSNSSNNWTVGVGVSITAGLSAEL